MSEFFLDKTQAPLLPDPTGGETSHVGSESRGGVGVARRIADRPLAGTHGSDLRPEITPPARRSQIRGRSRLATQRARAVDGRIGRDCGQHPLRRRVHPRQLRGHPSHYLRRVRTTDRFLGASRSLPGMRQRIVLSLREDAALGTFFEYWRPVSYNLLAESLRRRALSPSADFPQKKQYFISNCQTIAFNKSINRREWVLRSHRRCDCGSGVLSSLQLLHGNCRRKIHCLPRDLRSPYATMRTG